MSKSKERSEVEALRARNKKLEKENKELRRDINRLSKRGHQYSDLEERIRDEELEKTTEKVVSKCCPKCNKGKLSTSDLGVRKLTTCSNCEYRKSTK